MTQEILLLAGAASITVFLIIIFLLLFLVSGKKSRENSRISEDLNKIKSQIAGPIPKRVSRKLR